MKKSIVLHFQHYECVKDLSFEEKGVLFDTIFTYAMTGEINENLSGVLKMAFSFIKNQLDMDEEKYKAKCEKNKENVVKRWENTKVKSDTNEYERKKKTRTNTNDTDNDNDNVIVNDFILSPNGDCEQSESDSPVPARLEYQKILQLYHSICVSYPQIRSFTESRKKKVRLRVEEILKAFPDTPYLDTILEIFKKLQESKFCRGENNKGWKATFDWLFDNDRNWAKLMEGNYDSKQEEHDSPYERITFND